MAPTESWKKYYDRKASSEDELRSQDYTSNISRKSRINFILGAANYDQRCVLDLGCGQGLISKKLMELGAHVFGFDISFEMLKRNSNSVRIVGIGGNLPFKDNTFDIIVTVEVLQCIANQKEFFRECNRVLKPGGTFILTTLNQSIKYKLGKYDRNYQYYKGKMLYQYLLDCNFYDIQIHYIPVFQDNLLHRTLSLFAGRMKFLNHAIGVVCKKRAR
jgi:ubiquinone/menaquinone biosynthesis C-methylase UbiE